MNFTRFSLVLVAALAFAAAAHAASPSLLNVDATQRDDATGGDATPPTIVLTSEHGYRWAKLSRYTVTALKDGSYSITVERQPYGTTKTPQGPTAFPITKDQYDALVAVIRQADALNLTDNTSKKSATDLPDDSVTINLDGKTASWHAIGAFLLRDGHTAVVNAVSALAEQALPTPHM